MRIISFLILLAVAIFCVEAFIFRGQCDSTFQGAVGYLPDRPDEALKAIKPIFTYSDITTFGKAGETEEKFFAAMRDKITGELESPKVNDQQWPNKLEANLRVLTEAQSGLNYSTEKRRAEIVEAVQKAEPRLREQVGLAAWDNLVAKMDRARDQAWIPVGSMNGAEEWIQGLHAVDRKAIGLREAMSNAKGAFVRGISALGLKPSEKPDDPWIGALAKPVSDKQLIVAQEAFAGGEGACNWFQNSFHELTPELQAMWAKLRFNRAAINVAHLADLGTAGSSKASDYLIKLYITPNRETIPTDGEIYGAFLGSVSADLDGMVRYFDGQASSDTAESFVWRALGHWTQRQLGLATGNGGLAQNGLAAYRAVRNQAGGDSNVAKAIGEIESSGGMYILLK